MLVPVSDTINIFGKTAAASAAVVVLCVLHTTSPVLEETAQKILAVGGKTLMRKQASNQKLIPAQQYCMRRQPHTSGQTALEAALGEVGAISITVYPGQNGDDTFCTYAYVRTPF